MASLNGKIEYQDAGDSETPEAIRVEADGRFTIVLPTMTSAARDRFTIAHELGHFFLHFPLLKKRQAGGGMTATRWVDAADAAQQRCEWEANWFAAAFVMPEAKFRQSVKSLPSLSDVARAFGVSEQAVEVRCKSLGIAV